MPTMLIVRTPGSSLPAQIMNGGTSFGNTTASADKGDFANRREVVHHGIPGNDGPVPDMDMSAQQHTIDENRVVVHVAVMSDVGVRHQQIAVADPCAAVFLVGAAIDGDPFAKLIVVANFDGRARACVVLVLWLRANHDVRPEAVAGANRDVARQCNVAVKDTSVANDNVRSDQTEGSNLNIVSNLGLRVDTAEGRDAGHFFLPVLG